MSTTRPEFIGQSAAAIIAATSVESPYAKHDKPKLGKAGPLKLAIVGTADISQRYLKQAAVSQKACIVATCARHLI